MNNKKLLLAALLNALGVAIYIVGVSLVIRNGEKIFGKMDNFLGPVAFLLLFVLSAAVTGALTLGRPAILYLDGQKPAAIKLLLYTIGWLALLTLTALLTQILLK